MSILVSLSSIKLTYNFGFQRRERNQYNGNAPFFLIQTSLWNEGICDFQKNPSSDTLLLVDPVSSC
jgi:hypothetical protein